MSKDSLITLAQQTQIIPTEGGTIDLAGMGYFTIPTGALSVSTRISVALHHYQNDSLRIHFEPHGQVFRYPAQLTLPQTFWGKSSQNSPFDLYYQSHQSDQWQLVSWVPWSETPEAFLVQIPHFSSYYFIRR
ncbi:hypothetical protein HYR99_34480 [Candidatus Poribacteria bacterium]|nr:hypothetical protein [Candidatus Poribacteria bacterium]